MRLLETLDRDGENQAACANPEYNPDWWFEKETETLARAICDQCPINLRCLQFALAEHLSEGIYGGFTPAERKLLNQRSKIRNGRETN